MSRLGVDIPPIETVGGIVTLLGLPMHLDRLGLLYTRLFTDLKGITATMDSQISRILAQGLADGDGPRLLARKLVSTINGTGMGELGITDTLGRFIPAARRAEILARTEIIRAHHLGTIQEYRNQGLFNIVVKAEWKTAGDDRVCTRCASLEGRVFTLDEIEPMIPLHPQCRCIALPYVEELLKYKIR
jgi:SPP1 gp7 family putative phage head morphogenesis protein